MAQQEDAKKLLEKCIEQEKRYQFDTLSREDVYRLGDILVKYCRKSAKPEAAEIMVNGLLLFRYYPEGASEYYRMVLTRKHNTANVMEKSSLRFYAENQISGMDPVKDLVLDRTKLQFRGGSFPIRLKNGCVIGSIAAAGLPHTEDHELIVNALQEFLEGKEGR